MFSRDICYFKVIETREQTWKGQLSLVALPPALGSGVGTPALVLPSLDQGAQAQVLYASRGF